MNCSCFVSNHGKLSFYPPAKKEKTILPWIIISMTVIFFTTTSQARFADNENENCDIEVTVYTIRMLNNTMWVHFPLVNRQVTCSNRKWFDFLKQFWKIWGKIGNKFCGILPAGNCSRKLQLVWKSVGFCEVVKVNLKMILELFYDFSSFNSLWNWDVCISISMCMTEGKKKRWWFKANDKIWTLNLCCLANE